MLLIITNLEGMDRNKSCLSFNCTISYHLVMCELPVIGLRRNSFNTFITFQTIV